MSGERATVETGASAANDDTIKRADGTSPPAATTTTNSSPSVPRSPALPGMDSVAHPDALMEAQLRSQAARRVFESRADAVPWMQDYYDLVELGLSWRQAVWVLWMAQPTDARQPKTQQGLATKVLGLNSDRVIREWRKKMPWLDAKVAELQASVLLKRRADILAALAENAATADYKTFNDRRMALEMLGDYVPREARVNLNVDVGAEDLRDMDTETLLKMREEERRRTRQREDVIDA